MHIEKIIEKLLSIHVNKLSFGASCIDKIIYCITINNIISLVIENKGK